MGKPAQDLNRGFAVVIDDKVFDEKKDDLIFGIVDKMEQKGIPVCKYKSLEDAERFLHNFLQLNLLVLDWKFYEESGVVRLPQGVKDENAKNNIAFIKKFMDVSFAPVLIFSYESAADVFSELEKFSPDLVNEDPKRNFILIKTKADVSKDEKLFETINDWIHSNPAIYTLKTWDDSFLRSKNEVFWDLFTRSPIWPKILWSAYKKDGVDESSNILELLHRLVSGRTKHVALDEKSITGREETKVDPEDVKAVIVGAMFINASKISESDIQPGDIFKEGKGKYLINVRPACDTVVNRKAKDGVPAFDGQVYLVRGEKATSALMGRRYDEEYGIIEQPNEFLLYGIDGKDFFRFSLKELVVKPYEELKSKRIQRLLPPYVTHLQQKYSAYSSRTGLPRFPDDVLKEMIKPSTLNAS